MKLALAKALPPSRHGFLEGIHISFKACCSGQLQQVLLISSVLFSFFLLFIQANACGSQQVSQSDNKDRAGPKSNLLY